MTREEVIERILEITAGEVGIGEVPPGSNLGPCRKYGGKKGPWCVHFCNWVWHEATGCWPTSAGNTGGSFTLIKAAKRDGTWIARNPQPGDIALKPRYDERNGKRVRVGNHAMLVAAVNGKTMTTWEGNSNDKVARRERDVKDCMGFIRGRVTT